MTRVITYGTYDLLHYGHIRLLERAKALGDYLIVGVTADSFDRTRGKINVQQSLMERIEAVKALGIADEIIVEEYEGQKIDDIKRYDIDIFTVGSDWVGKFDYLNEYCKVVYLDRTQGVSSTEIRSEKHELRLGLVGTEIDFLNKMIRESRYVNGISIKGVCIPNIDAQASIAGTDYVTTDYQQLLQEVDAVYIISLPQQHKAQIEQALRLGKHILCESPIAICMDEWKELQSLAKENNVVLMDAIRTAYSTAYNRMLLLVKSGVIGQVVSVDATCTSLRDNNAEDLSRVWNSICSWGPNALLPVFQMLGTEYRSSRITSHLADEKVMYDTFTKITFEYPEAVASIKVGKGVKSEGELIVSGTDGYIYVPAPWWKTEYFEIRRENPADNKRYFYQLDGEGIRYELVSFLHAIENKKGYQNIEMNVSKAIVEIMEQFYQGNLIKI